MEFIAEGGSFFGYWISTFIIAVIPTVVASVFGGALFFLIARAVDRSSSKNSDQKCDRSDTYCRRVYNCLPRV